MNVNHQEPDSSQEGKAQTSDQLSQLNGCSQFLSADSEIATHTGNIKTRNSRREFRWSKAARDLVRAKMNATGREVSSLVSQLAEESGHPRWACRRFLRRMGIRSRRPYRTWSEQEQHRLLKLIDLHPVNEIAKLLRRSQSSIWHMLQRLDANAQMGKDSFTKYTLAVALHVRPEKIQDWIARGWLKARDVEIGKGKRTVIEAEDFCEFCRKHTRDVIGNRLTEERLDFVYHFVFPPSHATLLPVRESMKESNAYEEQMKGKRQVRGTDEFGADDSEPERDMLAQTA
jgi:hypothetical protein